jgi:anti-sigma-K factor RskA
MADQTRMPTLRERLADLWSDATFGRDASATAIVAAAFLLLAIMLVGYLGFARSVWRWWLS